MNNENPTDPLPARMGLSKAAELDAVTGRFNDIRGAPTDYEHAPLLGIGYFPQGPTPPTLGVMPTPIDHT